MGRSAAVQEREGSKGRGVDASHHLERLIGPLYFLLDTIQLLSG